MKTKIITTGIVVTALVVFVWSVIEISNKIEEEGGFRQIVVNVGKEFKSIATDINDENVTKEQ